MCIAGCVVRHHREATLSTWLPMPEINRWQDGSWSGSRNRLTLDGYNNDDEVKQANKINNNMTKIGWLNTAKLLKIIGNSTTRHKRWEFGGGGSMCRMIIAVGLGTFPKCWIRSYGIRKGWEISCKLHICVIYQERTVEGKGLAFLK